MANPFYIPQGPSVGERVAQPLTELMRIRQAGELGAEHNRLMGEDIALRSKGQNIESQKLTETQRHNKATELISKQNFGKNEAAMFGQMLERLKIAKPLKFLTDDFTSMAENPGIDKGSFYGFFKGAWPEYQGRIVESLKEAAMDETQTPWMKQHYTKLADAIEKDKDGKLLDTLMPNVAMEWQAAQAESASKVSSGIAPRVVSPGGALVDNSGNVLFQAPRMETEDYIQVPTTEGIYKLNKKSGMAQLMTGPGGQPLMSPSADPNLAGEKEKARKEADRVAELKKIMPKSRETLSSLERQWDIVDKTIDKALSQIGPFTSGFGAYLSSLPTTEARNLRENLTTIRANIGFDKLQDMRINSPTGGALGNVSDNENALTQATQGSLDQFQSDAQLRENLLSIKANLQGLRAQKRFAFDYDFREVRQPNQSEPPREKVPSLRIGSVEDGYEYLGGDPGNPSSWKKVD